MNIIGKTTINPVIFYSGKISGYAVWITLVLHFQNIELVNHSNNKMCELISYITLFFALFFTINSFINLGKSTRFGIPTDDTEFKTNGIYRISRNPMYVGFSLLTISGMINLANIWVIVAGIYSIIVYHLIILGEEKFLEKRFGEKYLEYKKVVRRYL